MRKKTKTKKTQKKYRTELCELCELCIFLEDFHFARKIEREREELDGVKCVSCTQKKFGFHSPPKDNIQDLLSFLDPEELCRFH